jgi:zinc transport system ATP-binding protein
VTPIRKKDSAASQGRDLQQPLHALEVEHLAVHFGAVEIFRDVNFSVPRGSSLAVIGPNGAGKTVLFRALIGSLPYEGRVLWAPGIKLGYVPQKLDIERDLPITGGDLLRARSAIARKQKTAILTTLVKVGLQPEILRATIGAMSGGQFQRLLIAFALLGDPNVLLLDEPAAGVDAPGQQQLSKLLQELQEESGMTIILISHDLSVVYRYATNVLCLSKVYSCFGPPQMALAPEVLRRLYGTPIGFHVHNVP